MSNWLERFEQWFYSQLDYYCQMVGIQLTLTCRYCNKELESCNIVNHIKWHKDKGDKRG